MANPMTQDPAMAEREAVVKFMRRKSDEAMTEGYPHQAIVLSHTADAIESGQHKEMGDDESNPKI